MILKVSVSRVYHRIGISSWQNVISSQSTRRSTSGGRRPRPDPPLPALTNPVEHAIASAQRRGDLSNLSGAGKPLTAKSDSSSRPAVPGMSTSELLSKKAEFEMRRAVQSGELEHLQGGKLKAGTNVVSTSIGGSSGSSAGGEQQSGAGIMGRYILKEGMPVTSSSSSEK